MSSSNQCRLLGGPPAWTAQFIVALLALSALLYKRHREKPQRPIKIWSFDVSKQVLSILAAHIMGMTIASLMSVSGHREISDCAWYFVAFMVDTTLGVALSLGLHSLALKLAKHASPHSKIATRIHNCGDYGDPPQLSYLWPQALEWMTAVIIARVCCGILVYIFKWLLVYVARLLDRLFEGHPVALLFFVMICCPLFMNILQAVVQDIALKWKAAHPDVETGAATGPDLGREMTGSLLDDQQKASLSHLQPNQMLK